MWVGGWGWVGGVKRRAISCGGWVGGLAAPEGRMVVRWEGGLCVLKKLHADQKWVVRKRTERRERDSLVEERTHTCLILLKPRKGVGGFDPKG